MLHDSRINDKVNASTNTIVIITTDYWYYDIHRYELFKDVEEKVIPFWTFDSCPTIYSKLLTQKIREIIDTSTEEVIRRIFEPFPEILNIIGQVNYLNKKQFAEQIEEKINESFDLLFINNDITNRILPEQLIFKRIKDTNIFVLPPIPDNFKNSHEDKYHYVDFLIKAWSFTFNDGNEPEDNSRFIFVLHEKDLGLNKEYKENVIGEADFIKEGNNSLSDYFSEETKTKILNGQYDILVFQHDSMNSPNINGDFLVKSERNDKNLIDKLEKITSLLKVSWSKWYSKRNEIILKLINNEDISSIINELKKMETDYEQMKLIDENALNIIIKDSLGKSPYEIKDAFDSIFEKANISSIFQV